MQIKNDYVIIVWQCCKLTGTFIHGCWEDKLIELFWKTVWQFLKKLIIELTCHPAIPLLSICSSELKYHVHTKMYTERRAIALWVKVKVSQSCLTLCDPMDYIVHGILQARILKWVAFPFSRGSSQPRDQTQVSCIAGGFFTSWGTSKAQENWSGKPILSAGDRPNPGTKPGSPALQEDSLPT